MTGEDKETGIKFDDRGIGISKDLLGVFEYLMYIEKDIKEIFLYEKKIEECFEYYRDMVDFAGYVSKHLDKNKSMGNFSFKKDHLNFKENIQTNRPVMSQMVVLFAALEALFILYLSFEYEESNEDKLRKLSMDNSREIFKKFITEFILTEENIFYKENYSDFKRLNATILLDLRNSLSHGFALPSGRMLTVSSHILLRRKHRVLEEKIGTLLTIVPEEFFELTKSANILLIRKWSNMSKDNNIRFSKKIDFTKRLVKKIGPKIINDEDLVIKNQDKIKQPF